MSEFRIVTAPQQTMFGKRTGGILARLQSDHNSEILSAAGPTVTDAKAALLNKLGRLAGNDQRTYLFCGDAKTVLVVSFAGESWQYDIIDPSRTTRSGCIMPGVTSFRDAKDRAYAHAAESYGGVINDL